MLEQAMLWFGSWERQTRESTPTTWHRPVRSERNGVFLGWQHLHVQANARWWWPLGRLLRIELFETEDDSLVFVLERNVGLYTSWRLTEADGLEVGEVLEPSLIDSNGERRAILDCPTPSEGRVLDFASTLLADFRHGAEELNVRLYPTLGENPFLRMLVLAGILALQPTPK